MTEGVTGSTTLPRTSRPTPAPEIAWRWRGIIGGKAEQFCEAGADEAAEDACQD